MQRKDVKPLTEAAFGSLFRGYSHMELEKKLREQETAPCRRS
jgi:hypothetical protein